MLIIDGYNILMQISALKNKPLERGREEFLRKISRKGKLFGGVTIVFDGWEKVKRSRISFSNLHVVFSGEEKADDYIKRIVKNASHPQDIVVATDDREIQEFTRLNGGKVISGKELIEKVFPPKPKTPHFQEVKPTPESEKGRKITEILKKEWKIQKK